MDSFRKRIIKKVLLDLLITPLTVVPALVGGSLLLMSEVLGGYAAFLGFSGLCIAFGVFLTNLVFNLEKMSQRALKQLHEQQLKQREKELDSLDRKLQRTDDERDEGALRNLRTLYKSFGTDIAGGKLSQNIPPQMLQSVDEIFTTCIQKLERSYEIHRTSSTMNGKLKRDLLQQRERIIDEVEHSVLEVANVINEVRALKFRSENDELQKLQIRLNSQLEVAKATEDVMAELSGSRIDEKLKEYE